MTALPQHIHISDRHTLYFDKGTDQIARLRRAGMWPLPARVDVTTLLRVLTEERSDGETQSS